MFLNMYKIYYSGFWTVKDDINEILNGNATLQKGDSGDDVKYVHENLKRRKERRDAFNAEVTDSEVFDKVSNPKSILSCNGFFLSRKSDIPINKKS